MITHFVQLELQTVSLEGVKQVYAERLEMPIVDESQDAVSFELTDYTTLKFVERYEPLSPAHFAFEVPYSTYHESVAAVKVASLIIVGEVTWDNGMSLYFRDGDGNILEIYAHDYISEGVLPAHHPLRVLYLREIGFPVESMSRFREWLETYLAMQRPPSATGDDFSFVIGGTAHAVVVNQTRPWIPIAMRALPPPMRVTFGTPDLAFLETVRAKLQEGDELLSTQDDQLAFTSEGYSLDLLYTPQFPVDIPARLNLPRLS